MGNCISSDDHQNVRSPTPPTVILTSPDATMAWNSPTMSEVALSEFYARLGIRSLSTVSPPYTESFQGEHVVETTTANLSRVTSEGELFYHSHQDDNPALLDDAFLRHLQKADRTRLGIAKGELEGECDSHQEDDRNLPHALNGSPSWSRQSSLASIFTPTECSLFVLQGRNNKPSNPLDPNSNEGWQLETRPSSPESD